MRFDDSVGDFVMDQEQLERDLEADEPDNVRIARVCLPAMNSVSRDLKKNLPRRDCQHWTL